MEREPNQQKVKWFLEQNASGQLVLDPPYQRRTVWSLAYRQFFIDTVLRNFPSPAIFIDWQIDPGKPTVYNVVDGKQRLSALIDFTKGGFHLGDLFENEGLVEPYWGDLSDELRHQLVSYSVTVENLSNASESDLRDAFNRLNKNVAGLTKQELRHAQFDGDFIRAMEVYAELPFWAEHHVFSAANIRRMRDVEFVSELFLLTMHGVQDGTGKLDEYYAEYESGIPNERRHKALFAQVIDWLDRVPIDWNQTRWSNMTDLYSLWGALLKLRKGGKLPAAGKTAARRLEKFSQMQADILAAERADEDLPGTARDRRYFANFRQGGNKDTSRTARINALAGALKG